MTEARRVLLLASGQRIRAGYAEWVRRSVGCTHVVVAHGAQASRTNWPKDPAVVAYIVDASGHGLGDRLHTEYPGKQVMPLSRRKAVAAKTLGTFQFGAAAFNAPADALDPREALRATLVPQGEPSMHTDALDVSSEAQAEAEFETSWWLVRLKAVLLEHGYAQPPGLEDVAYLRQKGATLLHMISWRTIEQSCGRRGIAACPMTTLDKCVRALRDGQSVPFLVEPRLVVVDVLAKAIQEKGPPRNKRQFGMALYDVTRKKFPALQAERWRSLDGVLEEIMALARAEYDLKSRAVFGRDFEKALAAWPGAKSRVSTEPAKPAKPAKWVSSGSLVAELRRHLREATGSDVVAAADLAWLRQQDELHAFRALSWEEAVRGCGKHGSFPRKVSDEALLKAAYAMTSDTAPESPAIAARFVLVKRLALLVRTYAGLDRGWLTTSLWARASRDALSRDDRLFLRAHLAGVGGEAHTLNEWHLGTHPLRGRARAKLVRAAVDETLGPLCPSAVAAAVAPSSALARASAAATMVVPTPAAPAVAPLAAIPAAVRVPTASSQDARDAWTGFMNALRILRETMQPAGVRSCTVKDDGSAEAEVVTVQTVKVTC